MKEKIKILIAFLIFLLPYHYLGVYCDYQNRSLIGYGIMLVFPLITAYLSANQNMMRIICLIIGSAISAGISFCLVGMSEFAQSSYFKPLTAQQYIIVLFILSLSAQIILLLLYSKIRKNK